MTLVLILLGGPGAGKGTQAVRLAESLGLPHISTGDLFRANLSAGTELGERARGFMDQGQLVPDEVVLDMLFDRVAQEDCRRGYLLDGFPRTLPQAEALESRLEAGDGEAVSTHAVNLEVPDRVLEERLCGRFVCRDCGNLHHRIFSPSKVEGVCDSCGGELFQRKDDQIDVVKERLSVYHAQTSPLVDFYRDRDLLHVVDGNRSPDEVAATLAEFAQSLASASGSLPTGGMSEKNSSAPQSTAHESGPGK